MKGPSWLDRILAARERSLEILAFCWGALFLGLVGYALVVTVLGWL